MLKLLTAMAILQAAAPTGAVSPAPATAPAARPAETPPSKPAPLLLKPRDDWGSATSVDENDAARFAPSKPAPPPSNCTRTETGMTCGDSETARRLAEELAKGQPKPD